MSMHSAEPQKIEWVVIKHEKFTFIEFNIPEELMEPATLKEIDLPRELGERRFLGLVISGRGPVWLYAYLVHLAHPFAWVATYDPRLNGAVVVMNHVPSGPGVGDIIPVSKNERTE